MRIEDHVLLLAQRYADGNLGITESSKGRQLLTRCPFHKGGKERKPSFYWNMENGLFYCQSCQVGGGLSSFMTLIGMDKKTIQETLDGIDMKWVKKTRQCLSKKDPLTSNPVLPETLLSMFDRTPLALTRAGFCPELLEEMEIGYDIRQHRITFPIRDVTGRLIGISGRADGKYIEPRYKFYRKEFDSIVPGYALEKGRTLWNVHRLWAAHVTGCNLRGWQPVTVLVEGFKAALHLIQHGYKDTVALMGSSMTDTQRFILSTIGGIVFVFLDNNEAGQRGADKVMEELRRRSCCKPYRVCYPADASPETQPDDLDPEVIHKLFEEAYR